MSPRQRKEVAHLQEMVLGSLLLAAAYCDIKTGKIPNRLIVTGWLSGMVSCFLQGGIVQMKMGAALAAAVIVTGFLLFHMGMIGAGDVKLFSVIGCMQGCDRLFRILLVFLILAGGISFWKLRKEKLFAKRFGYFWRYLTGKTGYLSYYEQERDGSEGTILLAPVMAAAYFLVIAAGQMGIG